MTITPDTIGPDYPAPSTDGWHPHAGLLSRDDLVRALGQARKDGAEMRRQRDYWRAAAGQHLRRASELEVALAEANQRAALNEQAALDLLGQIEDRNTQTAAQLRIAATALGHLEEMHR